MANTEKAKRIAERMMPLLEAETVPGTFRHNVADPLKGTSNIGIELGVATGIFSERMMQSGKFVRFFGVDAYADKHDTAEYKFALKRVGLDATYTLLRMRF